jgi:twitching motility two-component system response regulator PilH
MELPPDGTAKVLIADDDPDVREVFSAFLECMGKLALTAADGVEALAVARREHPSLIVLDLKMPRMDGPALRSALQRDAALAGIPVVVVSGEVDSRCAGAMGAVAALRKPPDLVRLGRLISELC